MQKPKPYLDASKPPRHLSPEAKKIWRQLHDEWIIDGADRLLTLRVALEYFDRAEQARKILDAEGLTITSRTASGEEKVNKHPCVSVEKEARSGLLVALKQLGFTLEEIKNPVGRPPGR